MIESVDWSNSGFRGSRALVVASSGVKLAGVLTRSEASQAIKQIRVRNRINSRLLVNMF